MCCEEINIELEKRIVKKVIDALLSENLSLRFHDAGCSLEIFEAKKDIEENIDNLFSEHEARNNIIVYTQDWLDNLVSSYKQKKSITVYKQDPDSLELLPFGYVVFEIGSGGDILHDYSRSLNSILQEVIQMDCPWCTLFLKK